MEAVGFGSWACPSIGPGSSEGQEDFDYKSFVVSSIISDFYFFDMILKLNPFQGMHWRPSDAFHGKFMAWCT